MAVSEQMLALMTELCSAAPTVLVVDDLQWADLATIGVWEWLARSVDRTALFSSVAYGRCRSATI